MDGNPVKDLSRMFKAKGKELYGGKGIRVCTVSCMKLCPKKAVAVALVPLKKFASGTQFYCVAPDTFGAFVEESFGSTLA